MEWWQLLIIVIVVMGSLDSIVGKVCKTIAIVKSTGSKTEETEGE